MAMSTKLNVWEDKQPTKDAYARNYRETSKLRFLCAFKVGCYGWYELVSSITNFNASASLLVVFLCKYDT